MSKRQRLVVIGNGMAGARAVEEILARGGAEQFQITMFGSEPYGNYNRIMLSDVLNGNQEPDAIFLNPLGWYEEHQITLYAGIPVIEIDRAAREITAANGLSVQYDVLIIATGSHAFVPPMDNLRDNDGEFKDGVFVFRTLDDCHKIAARAQQSQRAAVIGGGLLGLEAARGLLTHGCEVHVIQLANYVMNQQLDPTGGAMLGEAMERLGVQIHCNTITSAVLGKQQVSGLQFKDGSTLDCDMLVISAGIKPNTDLAVRSGLAVERGIVVDNQMRSVNDPHVYAVGECAQHNGVVYGLVAPIWEQVRTLADHLTKGKQDAAYYGSKLATKLKVMGVDVASMGRVEPQDHLDEVVAFSEPKRGVYKKLIIRDDRLIGAILVGDTGKAAYLMQAFDRSTPLPEQRAALMFDIGAPVAHSAVDLPDEAQICNCNGVSKGSIRACVLAGKRSLKGVMEATRAGMGCGSCKAQVRQIVDHLCDGQAEEDPSIHYYVPGVPLTKTELIREIMSRQLKSVSSVFAELAGGVEDPGSKPGLTSLLRTLWPNDFSDERDARFINDRVHANIQKDATFSVVPQIPGGVTSPEQLRKIADVAERYQVPMVKLTGGQRIDLLGIKKEDLPKVWQELGMPSGHAYGKSYRTCKSCVGTDFCRYGLGDSTTLALSVEARFKGIESPAKMKLATAGCPRNCSEAYVKDIGFVAIGDGKWEIYVGGAAGAHIRKGDLLGVVGSHEDALRYAGRFIQYYRENAKYLERSYSFVERLGIEKLHAIVIEDSEQICAGLEERLQASIDAYVDPWLEANKPATPNQFANEIPVITLEVQTSPALV